jgi:hypothetical protein
MCPIAGLTVLNCQRVSCFVLSWEVGELYIAVLVMNTLFLKVDIGVLVYPETKKEAYCQTWREQQQADLVWLTVLDNRYVGQDLVSVCDKHTLRGLHHHHVGTGSLQPMKVFDTKFYVSVYRALIVITKSKGKNTFYIVSLLVFPFSTHLNLPEVALFRRWC